MIKVCSNIYHLYLWWAIYLTCGLVPPNISGSEVNT